MKPKKEILVVSYYEGTLPIPKIFKAEKLWPKFDQSFEDAIKDAEERAQTPVIFPLVESELSPEALNLWVFSHDGPEERKNLLKALIKYGAEIKAFLEGRTFDDNIFFDYFPHALEKMHNLAIGLGAEPIFDMAILSLLLAKRADNAKGTDFKDGIDYFTQLFANFPNYKTDFCFYRNYEKALKLIES
jgi:hypothetical protein